MNSGRPISAGFGVATPTSSGGASSQFPGHWRQLLAAAAHEALVHQQVARQIAHQRQFRRHHQVGALACACARTADDQRGVPGQVARRRIDLEKR